MAKVTDLKTYWNEKAAKAGLDPQQAAALAENPAFMSMLNQDFKPIPDYSHDLDETRTRAEAAKMAEYNDWFTKTKGQFDHYTAEVARLKALGITVDPAAGNGGNGNGGGTAGMTPEQIDALLQDRLMKFGANIRGQIQAGMEYGEIRELHFGEFKKPLDRTAFEAAWKAHPEWGGSLSQAYNAFTEPEREATRKAQYEAAITAAREEGRRDGFSQRNMPADARDKEFRPFFSVDKTITSLGKAEQENLARHEFMAGLREAQQQGT